jgi:TonB family protein
MTSAAAWFLYCVLVSVLLGVAALAGEEAARSAARPSRVVWFVAMLASLTIPGVAYFGPDAWSPPLPAFSDGPILPLAMIAVGPASEGPWSPERIGVALWVALSLTLFVYLVRSYLQLHAARRSWRREQLNGVDVWMTHDIGPAVFGVGEASILMPMWALELDERLRRLMLMHEEEHARAGDPQLVLAALVLLVAMPWNPVLWWQLRRLRMAVEVDCDGRVLSREPDRRRYGTLLLEVSRRRGGSSLVVAFAEPRAFLERRIRNIVQRRGRSGQRALSLMVIALTLFAAAFTARDPSAAAVVPLDGPMDEAEDEALRTATLAEQPVFTPYTAKPELRNREAVEAALLESYPPLLRDAGIEGTVVLWFFVDEQGYVAATSLHRSSEYPALDAAAHRVGRAMRFTPASNRETPVAVWVQIPITFRIEAGTEAEVAGSPSEAGPAVVEPDSPPAAGPVRKASDAASVAPPPAETRTTTAAAGPALMGGFAPRTGLMRSTVGRVGLETVQTAARVTPDPSPRRDTEPEMPAARMAASIAAGPVFTPYTRKPELLNWSEVERVLQRNYPPMLRDSGVGGTTLVWFLIDEAGEVERRQVYRTSGHAALDQAALSVADRMQFAPAENGSDPVPVWVQIPITFASR